MKKVIILCSIICSHYFLSRAQDRVASITVHAGNYDRNNSIVGIELGGIDLDLAENSLVLYKMEGQKELPVHSQLDLTGPIILWWKLTEKLTKGETRKYTLKLESAKEHEYGSTIKVLREKGNLVVSIDDKNVIQYNLVSPTLPEGISDLYERAGFIHPIWTPKGEVLTRIRPPDHYHHVGLWNPWTHTEFKGKVIDFWNLLKAEGTVKPISIISTTSNDLFGGFRVLQDHIDLNGMTSTGAETALKEVLDVRVWNTHHNAWLIDFTSQLNCATDSLFKIIKYRYQGFGFRATKKWNDNTATLLTSEGKNKADGNSTRAKWCDVNGVSDFGTSGILFITHPSNYNYPEPIRIWPVGSNNGKENVFFNFNPAMDRDWVLKPGVDYQLKYRMYVYDGKIDQQIAESLWADFAYPPTTVLEIEKNH